MSAAQRVVVYGGTGYVGSTVVQRLSALGIPTIAVSRSGRQPAFLNTKLKGQPLANVEWVHGDATKAETIAETLKGASCVITTIGSPPLPTFSQEAYDHQVMMNGQTNINVIDAAKEMGVKKVVLVSAHIPPLIQTEKFGYHVGKANAAARLSTFVDEDPSAEGVMLKPGTIYGTRHTEGGTPIPLGLVLAPVAAVQRVAAKVVPYVHHLGMVSVDQVADVIVHNATQGTPIEPRLKVYDNDSIVNFAASA